MQEVADVKELLKTDFNNALGLLSDLLVTGCRKYDAGMSEDRFKFVNEISEE